MYLAFSFLTFSTFSYYVNIKQVLHHCDIFMLIRYLQFSNFRMTEARGSLLLSVIFTLESIEIDREEELLNNKSNCRIYPTHIVSPRRHSLKNESEYNRGYSYANRWTGYSVI